MQRSENFKFPPPKTIAGRWSAIILSTLLIPATAAAQHPDTGSGLPASEPLSQAEANALLFKSHAENLEGLLNPKDAEAARRLGTHLQEVLGASLTGNLPKNLEDFQLGGTIPYHKYNQVKDNRVVADVTLVGDAQATAKELEAMQGVEVLATASTKAYSVVSIAAEPSALIDVAQAANVRQVESAASMTSSAPGKDAPALEAQGAASNQAEQQMDIDDARRVIFGDDGTTFEIGALSDSADQVNGIQGDGFVGIDESQNTGDLPGDSFINIIQDGSSNDSDEGRGMMELIYDIVDDCDEYGFATAFGGQGTFASNITNLANAGSDVIVDDIVYFAEPMFQDGVIAGAAESFANSGGIYLGSAGNYGRQGYQRTWLNPTGDQWMDFRNGDEVLQVTIAGPNNQGNNRGIDIQLQWSEPWGNASADLDIVLYDGNVNNILAQTSTNNTSGNPNERLTYTNTTGSAQTANLAIRINSGSLSNDDSIKMVEWDGNTTINEYTSDFGGTIVPHTGADNVFSVGASPYFNRNNIEGFSSRGPHRQYFENDGSPLIGTTFIDRTKPDFTAIDGVDTTFFGGRDFDNTGFPNFFGTSAAAPNLAAVVIMMLDARGSDSSTELQFDEINEILQATSIDLGDSGDDNTYGHGRVNALGATVAAEGAGTIEFDIYPNQFGDTALEDTLQNDGDIDRFVYAQQQPNANAQLTLTETSNASAWDPMVVLLDMANEDVEAIGYDTDGTDFGGNDDVDMSFSPSNTVVHYGKILSETEFSGSADYRLEIDGPTPFVSSLSFNRRGSAFSSSNLTQFPQDSDHFEFTVPDDVADNPDMSVAVQNYDYFDALVLRWDSSGNEINRLNDFDGIGGRDIVNITSDLNAGEDYVLGIAPHEYEWSGGSSSSYNLSVFLPRWYRQPTDLGSPPSNVDYIVRPNPVSGFDRRAREVINDDDLRVIAFRPNESDASFTAYVPQQFDTKGEISTGLYNSLGDRLTGEGHTTSSSFDNIDSNGFVRYFRIVGAEDETVSPASPGISIIGDFTDLPAPADGLSNMNFTTPDEPYVAEATETVNLDFAENGYHQFVWPTDAYTGEGSLQAGIQSGDSLDPLLRLYDANGNLIMEENENGGGVSERIVSDPGDPVFTPGDTYYAHVSAAGEGGIDPNASEQSGPYTLRVAAFLPDEFVTPTPTATPTPTQSPTPSATPTATPSPTPIQDCNNVLRNGGFEEAGDAWEVNATNQVICNLRDCNPLGLGSRNGDWWASFSTTRGEQAEWRMAQEVSVEEGDTTLRFYAAAPIEGEELGEDVDYLAVIVNGREIGRFVAGSGQLDTTYQIFEIDLTELAESGTIQVIFQGQLSGEQDYAFFVDDVEVENCVTEPTATPTPTAVPTGQPDLMIIE